jgi:hypothetical protein
MEPQPHQYMPNEVRWNRSGTGSVPTPEGTENLMSNIPSQALGTTESNPIVSSWPKAKGG